jgi:hypothetical protein
VHTVLYDVCGGVGGFLTEALRFYAKVLKWRDVREAAASDKDLAAKGPIRFLAFFDWQADVLVAVTRVALGVAGGWLLCETGQISGVGGAVAVGAAAPALLSQIGRGEAVRFVDATDQPEPLLNASAGDGS